MQGTIDDEVYLFDKTNKKQYRINLKNNTVSLSGNKSKGIEIYKSDKGIDLHRVEIKTGIPLLFPVDKMNNIYEATSEKFIVKHDLIKASLTNFSSIDAFSLNP